MNKKTHCIFCGGKNIETTDVKFAPFLIERMFLSKEQKTSLAHCRNCNIYYSLYRPNEEEMIRLYSGYRDKSYQKQRQKFEPGYTEEVNYMLGNNPQETLNRKTGLEIFLQDKLNIQNVKTLLDYGGDKGQFIPDCFKDAEKYVYEISNVPTIDGVRNISNEKDLETLQFDFVMCCHVLEHVAYPAEIINKLINLCKNNSYIYIEVPYDKLEYYNTYIHEHITRYSPRTFVELLKIHNNIDVISVEDGAPIRILLKKVKLSFFKRYTKLIFYKIKLFQNMIKENITYKKIIMFLKLI